MNGMNCSYRLLMIIGTFILSACHKAPPVTSGESVDPTALIITGLSGGASISSLTGVLAYDKGDYVGCLVGSSLASALRTSAEAVATNMHQEGGSLPSIDVDVSTCLELAKPYLLQAAEVPASVEPLVSTALSSVKSLLIAYGPSMECQPLAWSQGAVTYVEGIFAAVVSEIEDPDGVISVPSVSVDACTDAS